MADNNLAPVVLFTYNRPWHTKQTIEALQRNDQAIHTDLVIYTDGPKTEADTIKIKQLNDYLRGICGFKSIAIIKREKNLGLENSIINGVSEVIDQYEKVIVLEDDIVTSPVFLSFMNKALKLFEDKNEYMSISGYLYPVDLPEDYGYHLIKFYRTSSWGWATWKNRWELVDFDLDNIFEKKTKKLIKSINQGGDDLYDMLFAQRRGKINSWAIRFALAHALNKKFALFPIRSYATNIGHDNSGIHCSNIEHWNVDVSDKLIDNWDNPPLNGKVVDGLLLNFNVKLFNKFKNLLNRL